MFFWTAPSPPIVVNVENAGPPSWLLWLAPIAAVASAFAAWIGVWLTSQAAVASSRPVMSAQLRPLPLVPGIIEIVVSNLGRSPARDVNVAFDPPLPDLEDETTLLPFLRNRYSEEIPTVGPGMALTNVYAIYEQGSNANEQGLPDRVTITFKYNDGRRNLLWRARRYQDRYVLALDVLRNQTTSSSESLGVVGFEGHRRVVRM